MQIIQPAIADEHIRRSEPELDANCISPFFSQTPEKIGLRIEYHTPQTRKALGSLQVSQGLTIRVHLPLPSSEVVGLIRTSLKKKCVLASLDSWRMKFCLGRLRQPAQDG